MILFLVKRYRELESVTRKKVPKPRYVTNRSIRGSGTEPTQAVLSLIRFTRVASSPLFLLPKYPLTH